MIESGAGLGIGAEDNAYALAGATIADDAAAIFTRTDMVVKVKEPQPSEWVQLREDQIIFTYLHLAPHPEQARGLVASGCTAIAYETVVDERGGLPLLAPMSEVAGHLSIEAAGAALRRHAGGRGLLLGGVPGVPAARVLVIGGGGVGTHAARMAVGLGAEVTIIDRSLPRLRQWTSCSEAGSGREWPPWTQSNGRYLTQTSSLALFSCPARVRPSWFPARC